MAVQEIESIDNRDKLTELRTELYDKLKEIAAVTIMDIKPLENTKVKFEIELINPYQRPIACPSRRIPENLREKVRIKLEEFEKAGIIRKSKSPWSFPLRIVGKPDGSVRITVDYKPLNKVIKIPQYPAPYIPDYFNKLGKAKFFSKIDLKEAYYQIPNAESAIEYTAFSCTTLDIGRLNTTAGHLECDGGSERNVQTIKAMIRAHVLEDQSNWDVGLKELSFAYNTCVHESTRVTPYYAMFGSHPRIPIDIIFQPRKRGRKRKSQQLREVVDEGKEGLLLDSGQGDSVPVVTRGGRVSKPVLRYQA